jgi:soluble lytic murein transglycosylase-like protein
MRAKKLAKKVRRTVSFRDCAVFALGIVVALFAVQTVRSAKADTTQALAPESAGVTIPWLPQSVRQWEPLFTEMGARYDIDPNLLAIITTIESGGRPTAKSHVGAVGLMQIMPGTAADISKKFLKTPVDTYNLEDPRTSIEFGAAYLAYLRTEFSDEAHAPTWNETAELVGAGYNGGPGSASHLEKGDGVENAENVSYARDVYNMWRERHAEHSPTYERWLSRGGESLVSRAQ